MFSPRALFRFFSSLRLTVALLAFACALVVFATLDQAQWGISQIQRHYFEAWLTGWPLGEMRPLGGRFCLPLPGGFTLGAVLLVNLVCAHFRHFRPTFAKAGIVLVHAGVVVLLAGGFWMAAEREEYVMAIQEGEASDVLTDDSGKEKSKLPFSLRLKKFTHEYYPGTNTPKSYMSEVVVKDGAAETPALIEMNHPLHHGGHTFFQSSFRAPQHGVATTILMVVKNSGWWLPYASTYLVSAGLLLQFLLSMWKFLGRGKAQKTATATAAASATVAACLLAFMAATPAAQAADAAANVPADAAVLDAFAKLPVQYNGRIQPADTFARNTLLILGGKQKVALSETEAAVFGKKPSQWSGADKAFLETAGIVLSPADIASLEKRPVPARKNLIGKSSLSPEAWLTEMAFRPRLAMYFPVFRVENQDVRALFPKKTGAVAYYSMRDLEHRTDSDPHSQKTALDAAFAKADEAYAKKEAQRTAADRAFLKLTEAVSAYYAAACAFTSGLPSPEGHLPNDEYAEWMRALKDAAAAMRQPPTLLMRPGAVPAQPDPRLRDFIRTRLGQYREIAQRGAAGVVPPRAAAAKPTGQWAKVGDVLAGFLSPETLAAAGGDALEIPPVLRLYGNFCAAWQNGDNAAAVAAAAEIDKLCAAAAAASVAKVGAEVVFNRVEPFFKTLLLYGFVFLLVCLGWGLSGRRDASGPHPLLRAAFIGALVVFALHTAAIAARVWLHGRPPATNLYSTAVVVAWGAVLLGLIAERFLKNGVGSATAAIIGFLSLVIAHNLSLGGDTMNVMRAVLDSNFWLTTHVVTITLGYSAMFVAGLLAAFWLLRRAAARLFGRQPLDAAAELSADVAQERIVYGVLCFAILLSFAGTMLGGIWADKSWGRFWGWDPKENGALLIVLWCAICLHVRWGNLAGVRGRMQLAVVGNIVTAASWFGTNLLGKGLHSYGFSDSGFSWLMLFWVSQIFILALGWLPTRRSAG
ncbi:MAG: cytochrome c biogenesis protein ResB [Puniceicoccales bacterium]|jgi:ABC-type transport system involved in cytochrome c biogenesis permease subunit|nr:cytochrome c biogenesis protein ResB [Puniceicoccales bacterium]